MREKWRIEFDTRYMLIDHHLERAGLAERYRAPITFDNPPPSEAERREWQAIHDQINGLTMAKVYAELNTIASKPSLDEKAH